MRIVTVRIEDNTNKIEELKELENKRLETEERLTEEIDRLQEEGFIQILAYIKCAYEDYVGIVGDRTYMNDSTWNENTLNVRTIGSSIMIKVRKDGVIIDFNYSGTLNCRNTPPRMKAEFRDGNIIITKSTRNGIRDLMMRWKDIKPMFQEKIDDAYKSKKALIKDKTGELEYLLEVAKNFRA